MSKQTFETVASFWIDPQNPEVAALAADIIAPLYAESKPGFELSIAKGDGQVRLGFLS